MDLDVRLRAAGAADEGFLRDVHASTREAELGLTDWSAAQKEEFCSMQSAAQLAHYRAHYLTAEYYVIEVGGVAAGRLFVDRWEREIRIIDIAMLPAHRGRGVGTWLLGRLQAEAAAARKSLTIHVEQFNPARRLYERLGFRLKEEKGIYRLMEWTAG